jgi:hypothetical protein
MLSPLGLAIQEDAAALRASFAQARPFAHVIVDGFLDPEFAEALRTEFPAFDDRAARNEMGETGGKAVVSKITALGPAYQRFDRLMKLREFLDWTGELTGVPRLMYDPDYAGGGTHENRHGQELDFHVDFNYHPTRFLHRRLNLIVFLNPEWEEAWGGCLELRQDPWKEAEEASVKIVPLFNRAVIFETTETSWHGFSRIRLPEARAGLSRRSLAVYFYTRERPAHQTAPAHSTVYIPRPLPARFQAGYTLSAADRQELEDLITRRDGQIRFLYEREKESAEVMAGTLRSPSLRVGRVITWPLRKALKRV